MDFTKIVPLVDWLKFDIPILMWSEKVIKTAIERAIGEMLYKGGHISELDI